MSHIDEGALHAYLDGALDEYPAAEARRVREHLDTCGECADRLAAERRVRERAEEILALAAPRVEAPTFEELRAYVRRSQGVSRVSVRLYRIGWAASVVLALGTGWLLRGQPMGPVVAPLGAPPAESAMEAATEASTRESVAAEPAPSVTDEPSSFERVEQAASPPAGLDRLEARAEFTDAGRGASPSVDVAGAGGALLDAADAQPARAPAARLAPQRDDVAADGLAGAASGPVSPAATPAAPPSTAADRQAVAAAEVEALKAAPSQANAAAPAPAADTDVSRRSASDPRLVSARTEPGVSNPLARVVPQVASGQNERVEDDEAVSLVVPGLEVLDVLPVGEGTTFAGMRALQRLQSGDTLELVHLPETVSPASLPALRVGWNELVRQRGAGWLVMRAPLSEEALGELLQRLEAGR